MAFASEGLIKRIYMSVLHDVMHFVRWRVIALRYLGKLKGFSAGSVFRRTPPKTAVVERIRKDGHDAGPEIPPQELARIAAIYGPRTLEVARAESGHPFVNLFAAEDISAENPVLRSAFSPGVLDVADDYFGGHLVLDSIQVLYSWPTQGALRESQMWHKDYGDTKSFHWIAYINDVTGPQDGPFAFIDKADTKRISRSPFIRRIEDQSFEKELGNGVMRQFLGRAGESVFVDPAVCYHSGSRCKNERLAVFVTFNTDRPFVAPIAVIRENKERLFDAAKRLRPDISDSYLQKLLRVQ
jgi:hypothetical protein